MDKNRRTTEVVYYLLTYRAESLRHCSERSTSKMSRYWSENVEVWKVVSCAMPCHCWPHQPIVSLSFHTDVFILHINLVCVTHDSVCLCVLCGRIVCVGGPEVKEWRQQTCLATIPYAIQQSYRHILSIFGRLMIVVQLLLYLWCAMLYSSAGTIMKNNFDTAV